MNISTEQKTAKQWAKALVKLNSAEPGTVQICYQDEEGNKQVGFCDLFKIEIALDNGAKMPFGAFLSALLVKGNANADTLSSALKSIENLQKELATANKKIEEIQSCIPGLSAL